MRILAFVICIFLFIPVLNAQNTPALCAVTCEPDPSSATYTGTFAARPLTVNARGSRSVLSTIAMGDASQAQQVAGSESYNYSIRLVSLPGRNGLDVNLALNYNSQVWNVDSTDGQVTFNADRDFPSYGFRLGYGYIETSTHATSYLLTEPDGSKRSLQYNSGSGLYVSNDSSYIDWNRSTKALRRKDGTVWYYEQVGTTLFYRPIKIEDTNGNYISITYSTATGASNQAISTITDTLGRVLNFEYNNTDNTLTDIKLGSTVLVAFFWDTAKQLNYNFTLNVVDSPPNGSLQKVITSVQFIHKSGSGLGMGYRFDYGDWGIVTKISQVTGSNFPYTARQYVSYNYPTAATPLSTHPAFTTETVFDGVNTANFTYSVTKSSGLVSSFAVTDPFGTTTTTNLNTSGWSTGLASSVTIANGTTLKTISTSWTQDNTSLQTPLNPRVTSTTSTLGDTGQYAVTTFAYDSYGNVTQQQEYDGVTLLKTTQTDYSNSTLIAAHILDRPTQIRVYVPGLLSRTEITYDGAGSITGSATPPQHDASFTTGYTTRGNISIIKRYSNAQALTGAVVQNLQYDVAGNIISVDAGPSGAEGRSYSSTTQWAYPDSVTYGGQLTTSYSYDSMGNVTSIVDPNQKTTTIAYDALNRPTTYTYPLSAGRSIAYDDDSVTASVTTTTKIDSANSRVEIASKDGVGRTTELVTEDLQQNIYSIVDTHYDVLGRLASVTNPYRSGESVVSTQYVYDNLNRVRKVIPPDGTSSANNTQYSYYGTVVTVTDPAGIQRRMVADALGRVVQVVEPGYGASSYATGSVTIDGTLQSLCLDPPACEQIVTDQGKVWITVGSFTSQVTYSGIPRTGLKTPSAIAAALANGLNASNSPVTATVNGATITLTSKTASYSANYTLGTGSSMDVSLYFTQPSFFASSSGSSLTGGLDYATIDSPGFGHPFITSYSYDGMGSLLQVLQGAQTRSFAYDGLGRMTQSQTPEAGTVNYTFNNGFSGFSTRTDARNVATNYEYDSMNRLIGIRYTIPNGSSVSPMPNTVCTPTGSGNGPARVCLNYGTDAASMNKGRLYQMFDVSGSETYKYDDLGRVKELDKQVDSTTYPILYGYNYASELTSITYPSQRQVVQSYDSIGRLNQIQSGGTNYLTIPSGSYNSANLPTQVNYGSGVQGTFGFDARLAIASLRYAFGGTDYLNLSYDYGSSSGINNGQIRSITDSRGSAYSTSYTYDPWGRLKVGQTSNLTSANTWKLNWTYDQYGNRTAQTLQGGTLSVYQPQLSINPATNLITTTGYAQDASGNLTSDAIHQYQYDGENRITNITDTGAVYTYDGGSIRVKRSSGGTTTTYIFSGTKPLAEYVGGAITKEYIYSGEHQLAEITDSGLNVSVTYKYPDHLSTRAETDASGNLTRTFGHVPFGETWYETGTSSKWKFTTYERDSESNNDYATFRYYENRLGRFMTADPYSGSTDPLVPQSWNRYNYVMNSPLQYIDPLGLCTKWVVTYWYTTNGNRKMLGQFVFYTDCNARSNSNNENNGGGGSITGPSEVQPNYDENALQACLTLADKEMAPKVAKLKSQLSMGGALKNIIFGVAGYLLSGGSSQMIKYLDAGLLVGAGNQYDVGAQLREFAVAQRQYSSKQEDCQKKYGFYRVPVNVVNSH